MPWMAGFCRTYGKHFAKREFGFFLFSGIIHVRPLPANGDMRWNTFGACIPAGREGDGWQTGQDGGGSETLAEQR